MLTFQDSTELMVLPCNQNAQQKPKQSDDPGCQRKPVVILISLEDFEHKVNVSFPQYMPGSHADVKIAKLKLPHTVSSTIMPFKGLMFYTLQFSTGMKATCSLNGQQTTRLLAEKNHQPHGMQKQISIINMMLL